MFKVTLSLLLSQIIIHEALTTSLNSPDFNAYKKKVLYFNTQCILKMVLAVEGLKVKTISLQTLNEGSIFRKPKIFINSLLTIKIF